MSDTETESDFSHDNDAHDAQAYDASVEATDDLADFVGRLADAGSSARTESSNELSAGDEAAPVEHSLGAPTAAASSRGSAKPRADTKATILSRLEPLRAAANACADVESLPRECRAVAAALRTSKHQLNRLRRGELAEIEQAAERVALRGALAMSATATERLSTFPLRTGPTAEERAKPSPLTEEKGDLESYQPRPVVVPSKANKAAPAQVGASKAKRGGEPVGEDGLTPTQRAAIFATQTTLVLAKGLEDASQHLPGDWCLNGFAERLSEPSSRSQLAVTLEEMIRTAEPGSIFHPSSFSPEVKLAVILLAAAAPSVAKKAPATSGVPTT